MLFPIIYVYIYIVYVIQATPESLYADIFISYTTDITICYSGMFGQLPLVSMQWSNEKR